MEKIYFNYRLRRGIMQNNVKADRNCGLFGKKNEFTEWMD